MKLVWIGRDQFDQVITMPSREADQNQRERDDAIEMIYRLVADRDDARRMYCLRTSGANYDVARVIAAVHEWDCFGEKT